MNFRGFRPGCGDSVADFWGWDAHEARLRCPDDVSGDMQEDEIPGGASSSIINSIILHVHSNMCRRARVCVLNRMWP